MAEVERDEDFIASTFRGESAKAAELPLAPFTMTSLNFLPVPVETAIMFEKETLTELPLGTLFPLKLPEYDDEELQPSSEERVTVLKDASFCRSSLNMTATQLNGTLTCVFKTPPLQVKLCTLRVAYAIPASTRRSNSAEGFFVNIISSSS